MDTFAASLRLIHGPVPNLLHALEKDQTTIGRSAGNELVLADPEVSRRHARVLRKDDGFTIEDLGSTNGTFINGRRINRLTRLAHGDIIDLGDTIRLRYEVEGASEEPLPAAAEAPGQQTAASIAAPATPRPSPAPAPAAPKATQPAAAAPPAAVAPPAGVAPATRRRSGAQTFLLGCGFLVALLFILALTFAILDTYQQGRLLYCGPLRPLFEFLLGPFGFAPLCP